MDTAIINLDAYIALKIREAAPFRALIADLANGMAALQTLDDDTPGTELYARLGGLALRGRIGDEVLCVMVNGKPFILGRVQRSSAKPTITPLANAGTGASTAVFDTSDDMAGIFDVTGGTGAAAGNIARITWASPKTSSTYGIVVTPGSTNAAAMGGNYNFTNNADTFVDLRSGAPLSNGAIYRFNYVVIEGQS